MYMNMNFIQLKKKVLYKNSVSPINSYCNILMLNNYYDTLCVQDIIIFAIQILFSTVHGPVIKQ